MHTSVKKQLILALGGCVVLTMVFGLLLSFAINLSLQELEDRQDLEILPPAQDESSPAPL